MMKKAEKDVSWTEEELKELTDKIKTQGENPGQMRDATGYHIISNAGTFSFDWEKVPAKYKKTFEDLKDKLKVVKPGS